MKGNRSRCHICGQDGRVFGLGSWFDECVDKDACRDRVVEKERRKVKELEQRIKELESTKESR